MNSLFVDATSTSAAAAPLPVHLTVDAGEHVNVLPAPPALSGLVACIVRREVRGSEQAASVQGTVPANAYACLNLVAGTGQVRLGASGACLPRAFVTGPFTAPLSTRAQAPLRSLSIVLQPWLLSHWFGLQPARMVNALQDLEAREAAQLLQPRTLSSLLASVDQPELLTAALMALAVRSDPFEIEAAEAARLVCAMAHGRSVSLAAEQAGLSERHFMRRFEALIGLNPVAWRRIKRFESALAQIANEPASRSQLGQIAIESGYADQSHMTREFRTITGATPSGLRSGIRADAPGLWAFKPAGHPGHVMHAPANPA
ncbi:helix-turn-helix domain-containing protein [Roseateles toxinivorans]|uniref:AraC-like DNA-binding protein n=1 Tax=Roseateles toxinivorans TaxID=270368 RepID=A0A4R6QUH1_9BURK|nr:helix-turn-helix domain-containing protein [Roseateles toxinivorans]TDP74522.1 AraC-like DNA-binding protein [Roseateles toxinivorans]